MVEILPMVIEIPEAVLTPTPGCNDILQTILVEILLTHRLGDHEL